LLGQFDADQKADALAFEQLPSLQLNSSNVVYRSGSKFVLSSAANQPFARWSRHDMR
jgi:hypothetical protein